MNETIKMPLKYAGLCLVLAGLVFAAIAAASASPSDVFREFIQSSVGSPRAIRGTLINMTPLLLAGLAVFVALRAGLFNIGAEGQLIVGACAGVAVGLQVSGPLGAVAAMIGGALAGALWAYPAGWIRAYRGGHEVITTIMLNNIAVFFTTYLVNGPLRDPAQSTPTTPFLEGTSLPFIIQQPVPVNLGLFIGVTCIVLFGLYLQRTVGGFELRATGANATAAEYAGVKVKRVTTRAMAASGALAGLAGAVQALAYENRFFTGFSPGFGFDALGVALLSGGSPWMLLPSAAIFGILKQGSSGVGLLGVPPMISNVLLAVLILGFAAYRYRVRRPRQED